MASLELLDLDLDTASTVEDVQRILDDLLAQEARIDAKLESLLDPNNQPDLTPLTTLQNSMQIEEQLVKLHEKVGPAAKTAKQLSERVAKLDLELARVKECLKYVEDVQELKVVEFEGEG